jgi:hypothetical protein
MLSRHPCCSHYLRPTPKYSTTSAYKSLQMTYQSQPWHTASALTARLKPFKCATPSKALFDLKSRQKLLASPIDMVGIRAAMRQIHDDTHL